ncbi:hypothetical protein [Thomasclavelia cocleata]|uniref:hypothetical protein n=1 Tax=Thomasclavelia cocleata TaxID=69824 RepID=UPI00272ED7E2|nr:hypothetical protein [Thomasclavelia cocleata]
MKLKFNIAHCKVYETDTKEVVDMDIPFTNERTLKKILKEHNKHLLEFEKEIDEVELTNSEYIYLYHAAHEYSKEN